MMIPGIATDAVGNMKHLKEFGDSGFTHEEFKPVRDRIERLVGLSEKYKIEEEFGQV